MSYINFILLSVQQGIVPITMIIQHGLFHKYRFSCGSLLANYLRAEIFLLLTLIANHKSPSMHSIFTSTWLRYHISSCPDRDGNSSICFSMSLTQSISVVNQTVESYLWAHDKWIFFIFFIFYAVCRNRDEVKLLS